MSILQCQISRGLPHDRTGKAACRFGATGQDNDQIGADRRKFVDDILACAITQCSQNDDCSHTQRHGQHDQERAGRIAGDGSERKMQEIP